ncbi:DUF2064 domain-containing protein [Cellulophaga sp. F20128]|uniref:TIGR04282 family arsenosugar biosynthesis glycosyltransferase n=1 Tax=Cellulophaga sp. F20128 TaxID=2926413 RepID=UPI001FF48D38|nr:DUF2064 domain-containing protein [Cellulophaga sp. F20128]MCK0158820.1 DUF2064 domain-containing protein [Cellulophaga sp. F20128]
MKRNTNKTVLLVFSLSARIEAERKPLFGAHRRNVTKDFYDLLIQETLEVANKSGVDVVWMDETQQQGTNFEERYTNAFKELYRQGYANVLSIGNDTPGLTVHHIKEAIQALQKNSLVFGPSKDGGVYLLGINKAVFNEVAFKELPWLTPNLSKAIDALASGNYISYSVLETLIDIDSKASVLEFAFTNKESVVSTFILTHFYKAPVFFRTTNLALGTHSSYSWFSRRGPPRL